MKQTYTLKCIFMISSLSNISKTKRFFFKSLNCYLLDRIYAVYQCFLYTFKTFAPQGLFEFEVRCIAMQFPPAAAACTHVPTLLRHATSDPSSAAPYLYPWPSRDLCCIFAADYFFFCGPLQPFLLLLLSF